MKWMKIIADTGQVMDQKYTILEHPADLGIEAVGKNLAEAFEQAALGLMSIMIDHSTLSPVERRMLELQAANGEQLLVNWLSEILYWFDGEKFAGKGFHIQTIAPDYLKGWVLGERIDPRKHSTRLDVKAITYHQIQVEENEQGGRVRVFLDI
jgi:SHS2 domain-containing protein